MMSQPKRSTRNYQQARQAIDYLQRSLGSGVPSQRVMRKHFSAGWFIGYIVTSGPNKENDLNGAEYWIQRGLPSPYSDTKGKTGDAAYASDGSGNQIIQVIPDPITSRAMRPYIIPTTNLAELPPSQINSGFSAGFSSSSSQNGSHILQKNQIVLVLEFPDINSPVRKWYVFSLAPVNTFILTGSATAGGLYTANPFYPSITGLDPTAAGAISQGTLGTAGTQTVYLMNSREIGVNTHNLATGTVPVIFFGSLWGNAKDGKPIFMIDECQ